MDPADHIDSIERDSSRIASLLSGLDLEGPVTTCPGWTVRDLVQHLGGIQRWATDIVVEGRTYQHWMDLDQFDLPVDTDLIGWFTTGAGRLVDALSAAPDDLECWVFMSDVASPLGFWARRQAHECAIHRVDAEVAAGALSGFDEAFAADGIDEIVTGFWARPNRGPRAETATSIGFVPDDHPGRWTSLFDGEQCWAEREVDADRVQATVHGTAADLFAWAWDRPGLGPVRYEGDVGAVRRMKPDVDPGSA